MDYYKFLEKKQILDKKSGFDISLNKLNPLAFDWQKVLIRWGLNRGRAALFEGCGLGKAQPIDSNVLTKSGWINIGKLNTGDKIFGSDGKLHSVLGVYPQGEREIYKITFSDKSIVECDKEHLWTVYSQKQLYMGQVPKTKTAISIKKGGISFKRGQKKNFVPLVKPIKFNSNRSLPLDPYTLGVIIGDGSIISGPPTITNPEVEIINNLIVPTGCKIKKINGSKSKCDEYNIIGGEHSNSTNPIVSILKDLGLYGKKSQYKFIPKIYLFASPEERLLLLQGLLDTDGYCSGSNIEFSSSSLELTENVIWLARSLGGIATEATDEKSHYTKEGKRVAALNKHRTSIKLPFNISPFRLKRKLERYKPKQRKHPLKSIISIEDAGKKECVCININSGDNLYITDGFTLTHNTIQQLEWANQIFKKEDKPILILAPLAVSEQTKEEGKKFNINVNTCRSDEDVINGINITNYEKLHKFDTDKFVGVVIDESSILKNFSSHFRNEIISRFKNTKYRLACTATPAPNDYMELGNHSEFLGVMTRSEMLSTFFINDSGDTGNWRLKGHVKDNIFWKWMASWSVMIDMPSDIGFEDGDFKLPEIEYHEHIIKSEAKPKGRLLLEPASTLSERRNVRKETVEIRCRAAADLINQTDDMWLCWCNLNSEGIAIAKMVEGCMEVAGRHTDEIKTERLLEFATGKLKRLVSKPKIAGFGLNLQICNKAAFIGLSDSWEQLFQAIRRIWRFGQKKKVDIHIFIEEREGKVLLNIKRKDLQARAMTKNMIFYMKDIMKNELEQSGKTFVDYTPKIEMELPKWIK